MTFENPPTSSFLFDFIFPFKNRRVSFHLRLWPQVSINRLDDTEYLNSYSLGTQSRHRAIREYVPLLCDTHTHTPSPLIDKEFLVRSHSRAACYQRWRPTFLDRADFN